MGSGQSTMNNKTNNIFSKELSKLNEIVNKVITKDDKFLNPDYNFLFEDVCKNYTILWEKELNKHLKVNLHNLSGSLYLLPKKDIVVSKEDDIEVNKQDLCKNISKHYVKILYVMSLIKTVYDLENDGDNSLAGILRRNINIVDNIMELSYCSVPHKDYDAQPTDKINFSHLQGFDIFIKHFLSPVEKYAFLEQFKSIFARKPRSKIVDAICHDSLVPLDMYENIYSKKFASKHSIVCKDNSNKKRHFKNDIDLLFEVATDNPILHTHYCFSTKQLIIPLNKNNHEVRELLELYSSMNTHYQTNVDKVVNIMYSLVERKGDKFELKNISNDELTNIITKVKQEIVIFYIQSIVDFHVLLDHAKKIPSIKTN